MNRKVVKSVSFNTGKADELKILNSVKRRNFSKYVKTLLLNDIERKERERVERQGIVEPIEETIEVTEYESVTEELPIADVPRTETSGERLSRMKEEMKKTSGNNAGLSGPKLFN